MDKKSFVFCAISALAALIILAVGIYVKWIFWVSVLGV